jgi:hypothetical protein
MNPNRTISREEDGRGWFRTSDLSRVKRGALRREQASITASNACRCVGICADVGSRPALVPNETAEPCSVAVPGV